MAVNASLRSRSVGVPSVSSGSANAMRMTPPSPRPIAWIPVAVSLNPHARVILHEPGDFARATDRDAKLVDPVGERALGDVLPEREPVRMARREVAQVELRLVEVQHLRR